MGRPPIEKGKHGTISVTPTTDGKYRARTRVRDSDGWTRDVTRLGKTEKIAERRLKLELKTRTAPPAGAIRKTSRLCDVAEEYLKGVEREVETGDKGPQTYRRYRQVWNSRLNPYVGGWTIEEIDAEMCVQLRNRLQKTYEPSTVKLILSVLSNIFQHAIERGAMEFNYFYKNGIRVKGSGVKKDILILEPEEVQELTVKLAFDEVAAKQDLPDLLLWMALTGERIANALALHWPWVDWEREEVDLGPNVILDQHGASVINTRDTGKVLMRTVGMTGRAVDMLANRWGKKTALGAPWNPVGPVFPGMRGQVRRTSQVHRNLKPALDRAGFGGLRPHILRKTAASQMLNEGMSLDTVAAILGQRSVDTTRKYYAKPRTIEPMAVAAMQALITPRSPEERVVRRLRGSA